MMLPLLALVAVADFGANPGNLAMYEHVPAGLGADRPLVVVLHGCTQTAGDMVAAGWNELADELGFAVVYPEQKTDNNPARCFNWAGEYGDPANLVRGQGENASIMAMIDHAIAAHRLDRGRVYLSGFSAGAAFTAVMLATWPDRIAGGAIQAGVPYRCATDVNTAFQCQSLDLNPSLDRTPDDWAALVRDASDWTGPWPRVSIWHGSADGIVDPAAGRAVVAQWTTVHSTGMSAIDNFGAHARESWSRDGEVVVESWTIEGMGHAIALGAQDPDGACAGSAAFYEDRGLCSTRRIARFFGLGEVEPDPEPEPGDEEGGGGGCAAGGQAASLILFLAILPLAVRGSSRTRRQCRGTL
jgi:poly(hydroxyalkanoate) depolymerase family esterase